MTRPEPSPAPDPVIEAYKQHVDCSLIRENLKRSHVSRRGGVRLSF